MLERTAAVFTRAGCQHSQYNWRVSNERSSILTYQGLHLGAIMMKLAHFLALGYVMFSSGRCGGLGVQPGISLSDPHLYSRSRLLFYQESL